MKRLQNTLMLLILVSTPAYALTMEADAPTRTLEDYIKDYIDVPPGATDWKIFGTTKEKNMEGKDAEGMDFQYYKPEFSPEVKSLDGKKITVKGFMFPLDTTEEQKLFLIGPFPVNCPFQYHVGPSLVIEVHASANPVTFSYDPITVTGKLELIYDDPENNIFYRLQDASLNEK
jgi:uncharacterized protein